MVKFIYFGGQYLNIYQISEIKEGWGGVAIRMSSGTYISQNCPIDLVINLISEAQEGCTNDD